MVKVINTLYLSFNPLPYSHTLLKKEGEYETTYIMSYF